MKNELAKIRQRLQAATPGIREVVRFDEESGMINYQVEADNIISWSTDDFNPKAKQDAEFIANAPTDIDRLLRVVERMLTQLELCAKTVRYFGSFEEHNQTLADCEQILKGEK